MSPSQRLQRVNEAVREVVSCTIADELQDPRIGFVTVTSARVSADLRKATVYVSVLGDEQGREQTLDALNASRALVQSKIARELHLKNTPTLDFLYDETLDNAMRLEALLRERDE